MQGCNYVDLDIELFLLNVCVVSVYSKYEANKWKIIFFW